MLDQAGDEVQERCEVALERWCAFPIPVMYATSRRLEVLGRRIDALRYSDIVDVLLADPLACLRVLVWLHEHRGPRQAEYAGTLDSVIMLMGLHNFFQLMRQAPMVDAQLKVAPERRTAVVLGLRTVMRRASWAARFARDWAIRRRDLDYDEVATAALLHGLAEMLLWIHAPVQALAIDMVRRRRPGLRSCEAQRSALGFTLPQLQERLQRRWGLSPLSCVSLNNRGEMPRRAGRWGAEAPTLDPRSLNVVLAVDLARHLAFGWQDNGLPDDFRALAGLLGLSEDDTWNLIRRQYHEIAQSLV